MLLSKALYLTSSLKYAISCIMATGFVLVGLILSFGLAYAQDQQPTPTSVADRWSPPRFLAPGWFSSMILDREGNLHVVYYPTDSEFDTLGYVQRRSDGTWTAPNDIFCPCFQGITVRNSITVSQQGQVSVVYRDNNALINFSSALYNVANQANMWSAPMIVGSGYYTNLFTDSSGVIHLLYGEGVINPNVKHIEDDNCFLCSDVIYRRSMDGGRTWSIPLNLSQSPGGSERMHIIQGDSSRLYIAWTEGFDAYQSRGDALDVRIRYSNDNGLTWSDPIILDGGNLRGTKPSNIAVVELRNGTLMAVWRYNNSNSLIEPNFYYQITSDLGKTWTDPKPIPGFAARSINSNKYDDISLSIDRLGIVHLFAVGSDNLAEGDALFDAQFSQSIWYDVTKVFYRKDEGPEWPQVAIGPSNDIHLTYFTRQNIPGSNCNTCNLKLYYSYLPGNMVAEPTRSFMPTFTPLPTATVFQNIEPTTTPFPTLDGVEQTLTITTVDNYAAQTFLGGMFISALFCGAIVLFLRLRR